MLLAVGSDGLCLDDSSIVVEVPDELSKAFVDFADDYI